MAQTKLVLTVTAVAASALLGATGSFVSSETVIAAGFNSQLSRSETLPAIKTVAKSVPVAGSEEFWLSAMREPGNLPLTKAVAIGDQISMTLGGVERHLRVDNVSEFEPKITEINTASKVSHFYLVTARDTLDQDFKAVRFVIETEDAGMPASALKTARAL